MDVLFLKDKKKGGREGERKKKKERVPFRTTRILNVLPTYSGFDCEKGGKKGKRKGKKGKRRGKSRIFHS